MDPTKDSPLDEVAYRLVEQLLEDDCGLWEAAWQVATSDQRLTDDQARRLAEAAIRRLYGAGLLMLSRATRALDPIAPIGPSAVEPVLADVTNWAPPTTAEALTVVVSLTKSGRRRFGGPAGARN